MHHFNITLTHHIHTCQPVAMYFRSTFVESCNQIHFWKAETSLKPKTMFPFERKTFWSAILDRKMDTV